MPAPRPIRVRGVGGVALHGLAWPDGGGRPVLLVHGLSSNCRTWEATARHLAAEGHPVVAVDLRGHGRSDKPDGGYDFATLVADVVEVLDGLGWDAPLVAGQSTGGNLAVELAAGHPGRVAGVAGVDGGVLDLARQLPSWEECEAALAPPRLDGTPLADIEARIRLAHPTWSDEGVSATLANLEALPDGTARPWLRRDRHLRVLRALWEQRPVELVARVGVPVLLLLARPGGRADPARQADAERARDANPAVEVAWIDGSHDLHVEHPALVARALVDLDARVGAQ